MNDRVNLSFNKSKVHSQGYNIISQMGRKKSEFIAHCVMFYVEATGKDPKDIRTELLNRSFSYEDDLELLGQAVNKSADALDSVDDSNTKDGLVDKNNTVNDKLADGSLKNNKDNQKDEKVKQINIDKSKSDNKTKKDTNFEVKNDKDEEDENKNKVDFIDENAESEILDALDIFANG